MIFDDLITPVTREQFFGEYWGRKPCYIPRSGSGEKFKDFPDLDKLPLMLSGHLSPTAWSQSNAIRIAASLIDGEKRVRDFGPVPTSMLAQLYNAGASLCFGSVHTADESLAAIAEAVRKEDELGAPIGINAYLTPPSSANVMHFDCQHVVFCQVSGMKHWKYSRNPAVDSPPFNVIAKSLENPDTARSFEHVGLRVQQPKDCVFEDVRLERGDVLYLPPGTWHKPETTEEHSLHYTLTFSPLGFWHVLFASLRLTMLARRGWMDDIRFLNLSQNTEVRPLLEAHLAELRKEVNELTAETLVRSYREASTSPIRGLIFSL